MFQLRCQNPDCRKLFEAQRSTAKYCSGNCRVKMHNKLRKSKEIKSNAEVSKNIIEFEHLNFAEDIDIRISSTNPESVEKIKQILEMAFFPNILSSPVRMSRNPEFPNSCFSYLQIKMQDKEF